MFYVGLGVYGEWKKIDFSKNVFYEFVINKAER
jgi:predicted ester cyclase